MCGKENHPSIHLFSLQCRKCLRLICFHTLVSEKCSASVPISKVCKPLVHIFSVCKKQQKPAAGHGQYREGLPRNDWLGLLQTLYSSILCKQQQLHQDSCGSGPGSRPARVQHPATIHRYVLTGRNDTVQHRDGLHYFILLFVLYCTCVSLLTWLAIIHCLKSLLGTMS